jgi:hypothetical protein
MYLHCDEAPNANRTQATLSARPYPEGHLPLGGLVVDEIAVHLGEVDH